MNQKSPARHKRTTGKTLKSFLGRHERLVSAVGALLVFLTFIMWEAVRDHLKDIDNELDTMATRHEITAEATSIIRRLQVAEARTDGSWKANTETEGLGPAGFESYLSIQTLKATQQDTRRSEEVIGRDVEYSAIVLKKLSKKSQGPIREQGERVASDLRKCKVADDALATMMKSYIPIAPVNPQLMFQATTTAQYQQLSEKVKAVAAALKTAQDDEDRLAESTVKSVEKQRVTRKS